MEDKLNKIENTGWDWDYHFLLGEDFSDKVIFEQSPKGREGTRSIWEKSMWGRDRQVQRG